MDMYIYISLDLLWRHYSNVRPSRSLLRLNYLQSFRQDIQQQAQEGTVPRLRRVRKGGLCEQNDALDF